MPRIASTPDVSPQVAGPSAPRRAHGRARCARADAASPRSRTTVEAALGEVAGHPVAPHRVVVDHHHRDRALGHGAPLQLDDPFRAPSGGRVTRTAPSEVGDRDPRIDRAMPSRPAALRRGQPPVGDAGALVSDARSRRPAVARPPAAPTRARPPRRARRRSASAARTTATQPSASARAGRSTGCAGVATETGTCPARARPPPGRAAPRRRPAPARSSAGRAARTPAHPRARPARPPGRPARRRGGGGSRYSADPAGTARASRSRSRIAASEAIARRVRSAERTTVEANPTVRLTNRVSQARVVELHRPGDDHAMFGHAQAP